MNTLCLEETVPVKGSYDVIVAGGGVAGCAAALEAARHGKRVLLLEKSLELGGLATIGLVNFFVPMCNGHGIPVCRGMAEEFLRLSIRYGYDTLAPEWKDGKGGRQAEGIRYMTRFSPSIFAIALTELLRSAGVELLFDTVVSRPVMEGKTCKGLVVLNKSGPEYYEGKMIVDTTGDGDVLYRAGVPTVQGKNYHTYFPMNVTLESLRRAAEAGDVGQMYGGEFHGGCANLYGGNHPEGHPYWKGTDGGDVSAYVVENQLELLENIKGSDRTGRDVVLLPTMPQLRTTRHIDGDYTMDADRDAYAHFADSVCAICDFDRNDYLYEVPLRCLTRREFPNLITAGRMASGNGYAWDVLRVIPPAILTGQAAGAVCAAAIDEGTGTGDVDIRALQTTLEGENVLIHFEDAWIPEKHTEGGHADNHI